MNRQQEDPQTLSGDAAPKLEFSERSWHSAIPCRVRKCCDMCESTWKWLMRPQSLASGCLSCCMELQGYMWKAATYGPYGWGAWRLS